MTSNASPTAEILLECSVLGAGRRVARSRTGIHRYIIELALALQELPIPPRLRPFCNDPQWLVASLEAVQELGLEATLLEQQMPPPPPDPSWMRSIPSRMRNKGKGMLARRGLTPFQRRTHQLICCAMANAPQPGLSVIHDPHLRSNFWGYGLIPRVCTIHDLVPLLHPQWCNDGVAKLQHNSLQALQPQDFIATVSEATRNDLLSCCPQIRADQCHVTPLAASPLFRPVEDPDLQQQARRAAGLAADTPYLLTLSTLKPRKNLSGVVRAYATAAAEMGADSVPDLLMIGQSGWKDENLSREIRDYGLESRIVRPGYLPDSVLPALYSGALGFLYPSFHEGFGLPVLEAMQCGTPVITSNGTSLAEIAADSALLVNPYSTEDLTAALLQLLLNPDLRAELTRSGRRRATQYSWRRCAAATAKLYALALQGRQ
ncbi:MAG: glycosyltransferase family 1 protein [Prochlorococcaceae cyanobacterium]